MEGGKHETETRAFVMVKNCEGRPCLEYSRSDILCSCFIKEGKLFFWQN